MNSASTHRIAERFASLNVEQRRKVYQKIKREGLAVGQFPILKRIDSLRSLCPVSYAQIRQWFLWQFDPASTAYHISGALRLKGELDVAALKASFEFLVARHESLRTVFSGGEGGQVEQVILGGNHLSFEETDLSTMTEAERTEETQALATQWHQRPFDLEHGPLLRVGLIREDADEHLLVVVMHHIISDGWSMQIIVDEFAAQYRARVQGEVPELAALPIQYADYAVWQHQWLEAGEKDRQLAYWRTQLGSDHPVLQLPTDYSRRTDGRYTAAHHGITLPAKLVSHLRERAREEGATLFMVLLTGLQTLLHRYSSQGDIRVGVPIANRHRVETEGVVGFFVNTQVLRTVVNTRSSLNTVLQEVKTAALGAQSHQDLPFEQLVEALQPERNLGTNPLFQVMYNHQRQDRRPLETLPSLSIESYALGEQGAQFELTVDTSEVSDGQVGVTFTYAKELFDAATIERMAAHYQMVLTALAEEPKQAVGEIELLSEAEREQLTEWGVNSTSYSDTEPVHHIVEKQVQIDPTATALIFGNEHLSYAELNTRSNRLAHYLIALGVKPEVKVGIAVERSIEMVVGLLAILKAGGAYVPLDPEYPQERLTYMIEDSGIDLLLTQSWLRDVLPLIDTLQVLELDTLDLSAESEHNPQVVIHGENLAYVIYTSGSTGKPKGAANRHRALHNRLQWMQHAYQLDESDTALQKTPFSFDVSVWEFFWPLMVGARLALARPGDHRDPVRLVELITRHNVSTLHFVPSMLQAFLGHEGIEACTSLRRVICSGEALSVDAQRAVFKRLPQAALYNLYGPTEAAIDATHWTCCDDDQNSVPIGQPISGIQTWVLDGGLKPVPQGVVGELYLGGAGLARGYLQRARLTAERFIADTQGNNGNFLYRTGDLVRWNADGQLAYLGRIDHQVKIRGFRIELGEVEAQLLAQPEIREAVAVASESSSGTRLVAYVCAAEGEAIDVALIRERLGQTLPDYMVPSVLVELDKLPLNANGKVDRKALPEPDVISPQDYELPQGELEETLASIWSEVLGIERVGRWDNFFELGGHSLLALKLFERMRGHGWEMPVRTLFQHPQLASFARAIGADDGQEKVEAPPNLIPVDCESITSEMVTLIDLTPEEIATIEASVPGGAANIQDIYPLAPLQEGVLFHHMLQQQGDAYITPHGFSFDSRERLERFITSLNQVISRHDILRTAVLWEGLAEPVQVVYRQSSLVIEWLAHEVEATPDAASVSVVERLNRSVDPRHQRIDVRQAPMLRAVAAHDPEQDRWLLQLPSHHLVADHTTMELIVEEMALIKQGRAAELPDAVPFRGFVAQARLGVSQSEHEVFFTQMLGDVEEPTAPFGLLDVQGDGGDIEEARLPLSSELSIQIRQQAQRYGVSAASLFHLAWAVVLSRTTGRDDVVFGTVLFGRMQGGAGVERALGMFINTLPIRVQLGRNDVEWCLRRIHEVLTELLHHEHASLALAQQCSGLPGGTPLFSALLNYRYGAQNEEGNRPDVWEGIEALGGEERTNYPVTLSVDDLGEGFELVGQISSPIGAERLCEYMQLAVAGIVEALAKQPQQAVGEIDLLSEAEKKQLVEWGINSTRYPDSEPVHTLIERQVQTNPTAPALIFNDERLSYAELNARSNRLAHYLITLSVKPEVRVGIAVERSIEMVVGLLAILKAGGAYVPLDPEYPQERLGYMIEDSGIDLLLTQSQLKSALPLTGALTILELDILNLSNESEHDPRVAVHGENLAYVIYTSGSTGKPKGAANRHRALHNRLQWMQHAYHLDGSDTVLQKTPFSFDVSVWEFFWPLMVGARLALARPGDHRDPDCLVELVTRHNVSTLHFVPSMLQAFLGHESVEACISLRRVICSGEALSVYAQQAVFRRLPQASLYNLYGPTEAAIDVTHWACCDDDQNLVPIGQPISDIQTWVLDGGLKPLPQGVAGELYLGGVGLARGYLQRPDLSAERFVADPLDQQGGRLYRTGDWVRWNADGQLEYLGRIDHQIKIRGFRIELGEVETQLLVQPEIREAVAVSNESSSGTRLVAYICAAEGEAIDVALISERLGQTLPDYMVPSVVVELDNLPLNANGKVNHKALPEPEISTSAEYEPPQGEIEEVLAQIWSKVLGVERVGRHDNFFELGGHSLLALKLLERVRGQGWEMPVRTLFQHPQLELFARAIGTGDGQGKVEVPLNLIPADCESITSEMVTLIDLTLEEIAIIEASVPGDASNIQDIYPLAPLQEGILFHHMLQQQGDAYITPHGFSFDSRELLERFITSFNRVIARHDILRTAALWEGLAEPVQVVYRQAPLLIEWLAHEVEATPDAVSVSVVERLNASVDPRYQRIDVRQAPLLRAVAAYDPEQDRWLLQLPSHHLVADHTTMERIVEEMALIQQGREAELPEPVPFRGFVAQARLGVSQSEHEAFFTQMLGDIEEPTAPFGLLDVQGDGRDIEETRLPLSSELSTQIRRQARRYGVSAASLFHLAWAVVLSRTTGRDDVVFGTVLFGRMQGGEGVERALGMFINTLPIRVQLGRNDVERCLQRIHEVLTELLHHEHASLALVQQCSGLPGGTPLFSALLNYRYSGQEDDSQAAGVWEGIETLGGEERTNYPVDMSVDDLGEGFELVGQISPSIGARRLCGYMRLAVAGIVEALANKPDQTVDKLELLSFAERQQLQEWGVNSTRYPHPEPVHRLIERQVQINSTATALIFNDEHLSYAEFNVRSNRLAHHLIRLGVKPEVKVGIALERSIEMVVGLLGILKAGGAYVPLDPEYPQERLGYMIEDSGIDLLLTQSWLKGALPLTDVLQILELDILDLGDESEGDPQVAVHGKNLAYVIYTSGSTGQPKGVGVPHHNLVEHAQVSVDFFGLNSDDRMLQFATLNFDGCIEQLFPPLLAGAAMVLRGPTLWDSNTFYRELLAKRITVVDITTAYWLLLVQDFVYQGIRDYGALRQLHIGGEAMPPEGIKAWRDAGLAHVKLLNTYGPTEATVTASSLDCHPYVSEQQALPAQMPIGTPLAGRILRVVDASFNAVPQGVAGELCIGGELLARGYLNRPDLSIERFVADPLDERGGRLYRTGDLVRWNGQGHLEYLGRIDHQVKIRGFRIELGEVEAQLLAQPEIKEAVVVAKESSNTAHLVGYVSVLEDQVVESALIRERLGQALPNYMVPSVIVELDKLPLNANGKVDRNALPEPDLASQKVYEPLQGETEEALAKIWSEILDVERIGRNDNFFELGGHSLLAIRLVGMMRSRMNIDIGVRNLYAFPTLRELSARAVYDHKNIKIVSLNTGNFGTPPLILIHDGQGSILDYTELARSLNNHCKVVALLCSHQDIREYKTLYDLATAYASMIIRAGYSEPYRLCGWCVGGAIAPLVASVLESQGKRVGFVGAIDPYVLDSTENHSVDDANTALLNFLGTLWLEPPKLEKYREIEVRKQIEQAALVPDKIPALLDELTSMLDDNQLRDRARLGGAELFELFMTGRTLNRITGNRFESEPLRAPVFVWWSDQRRNSDRKRFADWLNLSVVEHNEIRADHYEMVRSPQISQSIVYRLT